MIIRSMNNQKEFPEGTTVQNCLKALDAFPRGTLAALSEKYFHMDLTQAQ